MQSIPLLSPQMRANAFAIMHEEPTENFVYDNTAASVNITEKPKNTCYYIQFVFHNSIKDGLTYTNPETKQQEDSFEFEPIKVAQFKIDQDFVENYINHYEINVTLTVQQYLLLFYNYKDLKCNVKVYCADVTNGHVVGIDEEGDPLIEIEDAYCIFKNKQDILKRVPKESIIPSSEASKLSSHNEQMLDDVLFQIIPKEDYNFRCCRATAIFSHCTLHDCIWTIAKSTDCIEAIMLIDPDNTKEYINLVIPPMLSIPETLTFLQKYYGLYNKGLSFYYEFGILYIYPAYETSPIMPKDKSEAWGAGYKQTSFTTVKGAAAMEETGDGGMTHIYAVGDNNFIGMQYYHGYENNTIHIITNSMSVFKDLADEGVENMAYGYILQHANRVVDDWRVILEAKDQPGARYGIWEMNVKQDPNTEYLVEEDQNAKIGIVSNPEKSNINFVYDKSNPFNIQSALNSYRRTLTSFEWNAAVPLTFRPGYKIIYHFDHEDETARDMGESTGESLMYATKNGTVESATYTFNITKHVDQRYIYACKADVTASLELETTYNKDGM